MNASSFPKRDPIILKAFEAEDFCYERLSSAKQHWYPLFAENDMAVKKLVVKECASKNRKHVNSGYLLYKSGWIKSVLIPRINMMPYSFVFISKDLWLTDLT